MFCNLSYYLKTQREYLNWKMTEDLYDDKAVHLSLYRVYY